MDKTLGPSLQSFTNWEEIFCNLKLKNELVNLLAIEKKKKRKEPTVSLSVRGAQFNILPEVRVSRRYIMLSALGTESSIPNKLLDLHTPSHHLLTDRWATCGTDSPHAKEARSSSKLAPNKNLMTHHCVQKMELKPVPPQTCSQCHSAGHWTSARSVTSRRQVHIGRWSPTGPCSSEVPRPERHRRVIMVI